VIKHIQKRFLNVIKIDQPVADLINDFRNKDSLGSFAIENISPNGADMQAWLLCSGLPVLGILVPFL